VEVLHLLSKDQETPVQKGTKTTGEAKWWWIIIPTGACCKALFSVMARKVSPVTAGSSKRDR